MSFRHRLQAWGILLQRYREVFRYTWHNRKKMQLPELHAHEAEFLPASLALQTKPVSPAGRWVARIIMLMLLVLLCWAVFGRMDIVVNAAGKIIPGQRTKTIASVDVASVIAIHVTEGQVVKTGDILIQLDTRSSDSERDKADGEKKNYELQAARAKQFIKAINSGRAPSLPQIYGVSDEKWIETKQHLNSQWQDYQSKMQRIDGEIKRHLQNLPLVTQRALDYSELVKTRDVSTHAWLEKEQLRIDLVAQLNDAKNQKNALKAETLKTTMDMLNEANRIVAASGQDARKAILQSELLTLVAPVDGTVQQLTVHTVGGVVPAAQALMQIVPSQSDIEVEAFIENKDVGFVTEDQSAAIKIDAFEYTKYGIVPGKIIHVSRDAIQDEKRGLIYSVKVMPEQVTMRINGREVILSPGMSVNIEIKTGSRRIIEYVLSPLLQHGRESLNER
jgi:hemolysin D